MTSNDGRIDARDFAFGVLSVLWVGSFFFNGLALKGFPPLTLVLLRVALAACGGFFGALAIGSALLMIDGRVLNLAC